MKWNWESFPDYLDVLDAGEWTMDVAAQVPHGPLRAYAMGDRGYRNEDATAEDIQRMADMVAEAIDAGAVGFSTSRLYFHTALDGEKVPGTYASEEELFAIGKAMSGTGAVFEAIGGGLTGPEPFSHELDRQGLAPGERSLIEPSLERELGWMARLSKEADLPLTFLFGQSMSVKDKHREGFAFIDRANADGARLYPQVSPRPVGLLHSFQMYHIFLRRPTWMKMDALSFDQKVAELNKPEVRAAILGEEDVPPKVQNFNNNLHLFLRAALKDSFPMGEPLDFEPGPERTIPALAQAAGVSVDEMVYDLMMEQDGRSILFTALNGYMDRDLETIRTMITHPQAVIGGSDGGAHVRFICDAALPTFALVHWVRDRSRGERLPLEWFVHKLTGDPATLYGFDDRGVIATDKRADINVIDLDALYLAPPHPAYDLPGGSLRLAQASRGYVATFVNGVLTRRDDEDTGARPGRLLRRQGSARRQAMPELAAAE
jgi:N-acyl-D-aspartate/D-glutamate deacylase